MSVSSGHNQFKKVEAIVRKERFPDIDELLKKIGISGLTFFSVEGRGRAKGSEMISDRGTKTYRREYSERVQLEIIAKESDVPSVVDAIMKGAKTGSVGDGKIFVRSIEQVYDISTGEAGERAV